MPSIAYMQYHVSQIFEFGYFQDVFVDVVRYHTTDREKYRRTQNRGVMAVSTHDGESIEFYGFLKQIIELQYNSSETYYSPIVVLFRCDWFDTHSKKCRMKDLAVWTSLRTKNGHFDSC